MMKLLKSLMVLILCSVLVLWVPSAPAYNFCGFHDRAFSMTAFHFNSEFWVDMLVTEANKWNQVHSVLNIGRTRSSTVPVTRDGTNVISWISEADLNRFYNLSWAGVVAWTISWTDGGCGRVIEADMFFNPALGLFTPQTQVPYNLGYQETALHELGHVLTLGHEDGSLSVMTSNAAVSNVLYHNDKVGWLRSAASRFGVTDRRDMGVFPLRNAPGSKVYSSLSPATVARGSSVTIRDFNVENLSSALVFSGPSFRVVLENTANGAATNIGTFSWGDFCAFCEWTGNLTYTVPAGIAPAQYRVVAIFQGSDSDATNNRALFGLIRVT
jgi:hypothetical protein